MFVNGVEIYGEVDKAVVAYRQQQYYEFGFFIGEAFDEVFLNQEQALKPAPGSQ